MIIRRSGALLGLTLLLTSCSAVSGTTAPTPAGSSAGTVPAPAPSATSTSSAASTSTGTGAQPDRATLQARWWTWAMSSPTDRNPVADEDGRYCAEAQPGDVWFLAGTFGGSVTRSCRVPSGLPLAFPLVNLVADRDGCETFMEAALAGATFDGKPLKPVEYPPTEVTVHGVVGNPVHPEGGTFRTMACGFWAQVPPPAKGRHRLTISGYAGDFAVKVSYNLIVGPAGGDI